MSWQKNKLSFELSVTPNNMQHKAESVVIDHDCVTSYYKLMQFHLTAGEQDLHSVGSVEW